ncbi:hypothetical protein NN561_000036 [Cricetulus griseus]
MLTPLGRLGPERPQFASWRALHAIRARRCSTHAGALRALVFPREPRETLAFPQLLRVISPSISSPPAGPQQPSLAWEWRESHAAAQQGRQPRFQWRGPASSPAPPPTAGSRVPLPGPCLQPQPAPRDGRDRARSPGSGYSQVQRSPLQVTGPWRPCPSCIPAAPASRRQGTREAGLKRWWRPRRLWRLQELLGLVPGCCPRRCQNPLFGLSPVTQCPPGWVIPALWTKHTPGTIGPLAVMPPQKFTLPCPQTPIYFLSNLFNTEQGHAMAMETVTALSTWTRYGYGDDDSNLYLGKHVASGMFHEDCREKAGAVLGRNAADCLADGKLSVTIPRGESAKQKSRKSATRPPTEELRHLYQYFRPQSHTLTQPSSPAPS